MHHQNTTEATFTSEASILNDVIDLRPYEKKLNTACVWLYVIAGLQVLMGLIGYFTIAEDFTAGITLAAYALIGLSFFGLARRSLNKPFAAFLAALILYGSIQLFALWYSPGSLLSGAIFKVLFFVALIKGLMQAQEYEMMRKSLTQ